MQAYTSHLRKEPNPMLRRSCGVRYDENRHALVSRQLESQLESWSFSLGRRAGVRRAGVVGACTLRVVPRWAMWHVSLQQISESSNSRSFRVLASRA